MPSAAIGALTLPCLLLLLTACKNVPPVSPRSWCEAVPESLTTVTMPPPLTEPVTWGKIAVWSDSLLDALDSCNADKAAIRQLNAQQMATRDNE
ncbi:Rz1-like lysis system protein LysC [Escherichia coli]|uniref:Rz1-like lysis system protein LysC n=2 Tax=Escherichia coli TaxID=562 RepID=UPI00096A4BDE